MHKDEFRVKSLCACLEVGISSYYDYVARQGIGSTNVVLEEALIQAFWRHKRRYGTRRLVAELSEEGYDVGRKKVSKLMKKYGLRAIQPKSFVPKTTITHPHLKRQPNLLIDRGGVRGPNEVWVGDITYLPLVNNEWAYLATWLDLYSHHIVGWDVQEHMKDELVITAFEKAVKKRDPSPGLITHTDGGNQYGSKRFQSILAGIKSLQSMTRKNNHYDNAYAESLFSRFKAEVLEGGVFLSVEEARMECFDYIELYYNPIRRHSSLGYQSPLQFEKENGY